MYLRGPVVTSAMVFAFTGLFALFYPPSLVRVRQTYYGGPVGDKDMEMRLEASNMFGYYPANDDAWNSTSEGCGFRYNYNTETGVYGSERSLEDGQLCTQVKALDLYAVQGVEISTAYEDPDAAQDTTYCEEGPFCWYRFSSIPLLRHSFNLGDVDLDVLGVPLDGLDTWEVENLLNIVDIRGPHALANSYNLCTGSSSTGFSCEVIFDFYDDPKVYEPSSASEGKLLAADVLNSLVSGGVILPNEYRQASLVLCNEVAQGKPVNCGTNCYIRYPYSTSFCRGSVEIEGLGDLPYSTSIAVISLLLLLTVVLITPIRGLLAVCDLSRSRPHAEDYPVVPGLSCTLSQRSSLRRRGSSHAERQAGALPMSINVVEGQAVAMQLESWPGCVALVSAGGVKGDALASLGSVVLAFCIVEEGTVRNASVWEAMAMLEPSQRAEFAAANRNKNTIEWASAFSLYHCISCVWVYGVLTHVAVASGWGAFYWLLALSTYTGFNQETSLGTVIRACRFRGRVLPYSTRGEDVVLPTLLGAAQLWYELEIPNGWVLSWGILSIVVAAVAANAILVTFVYTSLPTADSGKGVTRTLWSVDDAMELCKSSGSRFGMAGDWVDRSRCGDIAGRTAFMTSLGRVVPDGKRRLGHVYKRSQTSWVANKARGQRTYASGSAQGGDGCVGVVTENHPGKAVVMVCAGLEKSGD